MLHAASLEFLVHAQDVGIRYLLARRPRPLGVVLVSTWDRDFLETFPDELSGRLLFMQEDRILRVPYRRSLVALRWRQHVPQNAEVTLDQLSRVSW